MSSNNKSKFSLLLIWALMLGVFWLLLSGYFKPLLLGFGLISVLLVVFLLGRMNNIDGLNIKLPLSFPFFRYIAWLMGQIVLSSMEVTKLVWGKNKKLAPAIAKLPVAGGSVASGAVTENADKTHVLYANSITLTPGTLSVDVDEEYITVHALDAQSIQELEMGEMARKVSTAAGVKT